MKHAKLGGRPAHTNVTRRWPCVYPRRTAPSARPTAAAAAAVPLRAPLAASRIPSGRLRRPLPALTSAAKSDLKVGRGLASVE